eukprot:GFYU01005092.1.p1 GENE.GFYU01005092.1~~GFYU01005092.1.p1  ORF type:complete len:487 (-),score=94.66 GFYU01005092.1:229-1689(-)
MDRIEEHHAPLRPTTPEYYDNLDPRMREMVAKNVLEKRVATPMMLSELYGGTEMYNQSFTSTSPYKTSKLGHTPQSSSRNLPPVYANGLDTVDYIRRVRNHADRWSMDNLTRIKKLEDEQGRQMRAINCSAPRYKYSDLLVRTHARATTSHGSTNSGRLSPGLSAWDGYDDNDDMSSVASHGSFDSGSRGVRWQRAKTSHGLRTNDRGDASDGTGPSNNSTPKRRLLARRTLQGPAKNLMENSPLSSVESTPRGFQSPGSNNARSPSAGNALLSRASALGPVLSAELSDLMATLESNSNDDERNKIFMSIKKELTLAGPDYDSDAESGVTNITALTVEEPMIERKKKKAELSFFEEKLNPPTPLPHEISPKKEPKPQRIQLMRQPNKVQRIGGGFTNPAVKIKVNKPILVVDPSVANAVAAANARPATVGTAVRPGSRAGGMEPTQEQSRGLTHRKVKQRSLGPSMRWKQNTSAPNFMKAVGAGVR